MSLLIVAKNELARALASPVFATYGSSRREEVNLA